jgi:uncharacterized 2Fe-2S/4Fe-4S cluster protein (DUF4445 family)
MTDQTDALIVFMPSGKRGHFPLGTPLLQAARQLGVDVDSVCGGRGICGRCKVVLSEGEFSKFGIHSAASNLSPISDPELRYAKRVSLEPGERLSCHATLLGDLVVDVPASSQVHQQVVRKDFQSHDIQLNPVLHLYYVQVEKPKLESPRGDCERLLQALDEQWQLSDLVVAPLVLPGVQKALRDGNWWVTVAIRQGREVVAVGAGLKERVFGVAVDIGSTTIAAHLCDLTTGEVLASAGVMNPQIRFGEDLMSRISYLMLNPGGEVELTRVVREALNGLIAELASEAGIDAEEIFELAVVGNPVMHHLFLGINPVELGTAPFALALDSATTLPGRDLELTVAAGAQVYVLPCIAGHVGADTAALLLAERPWEDPDQIVLLVDVGTNAEIVLSGKNRILVASSPTGPAFEGAQITCGQRAAAGAIERVRIDPETYEPRFKVIGCDLWSDDPEFAAQIEGIGVTGICGTGIIETVAELFLAGVINRDGLIDGSLSDTTPRVFREERTFAFLLSEGTPSVRITQNDVRAVQLAKGALYAGVKLLMDHLGTSYVDRIRLAGAFGSHIDVKYAMVLGLIPDCDLAAVSSVGNAAGTGAVTALLDQKARGIIEAQVRQVEKIETAVAADFQEYFVNAMALPHGVDRFTELEKCVTLPRVERASTQLVGTGRQRRRSRRSRES